MKKGLCHIMMSLTALLALVSCGSAPIVTEDVAKQRVQEINEKRAREDFSSPTKITIIEKSKIDATLTIKGKVTNYKEDAVYKRVLDLDNKYYYIENISSNGESRSWCYIEDNNLIIAQEYSGNKICDKIPLESADSYYESVLIPRFEQIHETIFSNELLQIVNHSETFLQALEITGTYDGDISYTSSEEGNLGILGKANILEAYKQRLGGSLPPISLTGSYEVQVTFDNYLLSSITKIMSGTAVKDDVNADVKSSKSTLIIKYGVASFDKPNLEKFTRQ